MALFSRYDFGVRRNEQKIEFYFYNRHQKKKFVKDPFFKYNLFKV